MANWPFVISDNKWPRWQCKEFLDCVSVLLIKKFLEIIKIVILLVSFHKSLSLRISSLCTEMKLRLLRLLCCDSHKIVVVSLKKSLKLFALSLSATPGRARGWWRQERRKRNENRQRRNKKQQRQFNDTHKTITCSDLAASCAYPSRRVMMMTMIKSEASKNNEKKIATSARSENECGGKST